MRIRPLLALCVGWSLGQIAWAQDPPKLYDLKSVLNREAVLECHDPRVVEKLERSGLAILVDRGEGMHWRHFYELYENLRYDDQPAFITTDVVLHYAHEVMDFSLQQAESNSLSTCLGQLLDSLIETTRQQSLKDPELRLAARRNLAYLWVAQSLLQPGLAPDPMVKAAVAKEKALIVKAAGPADSPLLGYSEDYSQYKPRGHYTRSAALKNYFRAMMWLGRAELAPGQRPQLLRALLLTQALATSGPQGKRASARVLWQNLSRAIAYFVGDSDNPTPLDYLAAAQKVWGHMPGGAELSDPSKQALFQKAAQQLSARKPRYGLPDAKTGDGFRLLGQAFVPDGYVLQNLCHPKVSNRTMVSGLDLMAVLGSLPARQIQLASQSHYSNYEAQLTRLTQEFSALKGSNLYWTWMDALRLLVQPHAQGRPRFMTTGAWQRKLLNTAMGCWTELRHDTILYAKPSYAEGGEGRHFSRMQLAKGYVEPEPEVYCRMVSMCRDSRQNLGRLGLLSKSVADALSLYQGMAEHLLSISQKELAGQPPSLQDYNTIREFGRVMETLHEKLRNDSHGSRGSKSDQSSMALVADVHTDALAGLCLEEGVGLPQEILVVVEVDGQLTLARGSVFSQYEFTQPISQRLSDPEWEQMLNENKAPALAAWLQPELAERDREQLYVLAQQHAEPDKFPPATRAARLEIQNQWQISFAPSGGDFAPRYSPYGEHLLYYSRRSGRSQVWVTQPDGTGQTPLTPADMDCSDPCFLPFECKLVFAAARGLTLYDYSSIDADSERVLYPYAHKTIQLTERAGHAPQAFVSGTAPQEEERLIYSAPGASGQQLYLLDPGTSRRQSGYVSHNDAPGTRSTRALAELPGDNVQPCVSPQRNRVAFTSRRQGKESVMIMDLSGKNLRPLVEGSAPTWSPDGTMLAYVREGDIWVVNADGSQPTRLTRSGNEGSPCWSRGRTNEIAFTSKRSGGISHIWVMRLAVKK